MVPQPRLLLTGPLDLPDRRPMDLWNRRAHQHQMVHSDPDCWRPMVRLHPMIPRVPPFLRGPTLQHRMLQQVHSCQKHHSVRLVRLVLKPLSLPKPLDRRSAQRFRLVPVCHSHLQFQKDRLHQLTRTNPVAHWVLARLTRR